MSPSHRLRPMRELPPGQAWLRLQRIRAQLNSHVNSHEIDTLVNDALELMASLLATRSWVRHDPACAHRSPPSNGATRCTCGLSASLAARYSPVAGLPANLRSRLQRAPPPDGAPDAEPG